ncbi:hypothetical protein DMI69_20250 [Escherichia coli]|nr:hypothetical protein [Escherichia coli]
MQSEEEFSLELRNRDRERKPIKKDREDAEKVEDEDFGYCESCGVEIGIRRLKRARQPICASTAKRWLKFAMSMAG